MLTDSLTGHIDNAVAQAEFADVYKNRLNASHVRHLYEGKQRCPLSSTEAITVPRPELEALTCELEPSHHHPSPRSACGRGSRLTDRRQGGASSSHAGRGHRVSRSPTPLPRRGTDPCCRARDGGHRRAGPAIADGASNADCAGKASYRRGRRGRGASSRTGRAGTLRPGAAGDGRGAAGSERSRWRDPSTAAAHPAGRFGGASRQ